MNEDEALSRLEFAFHRWSRGRQIMDSDAQIDWRDMSKRLTALGDALYLAGRFRRSPRMQAMIERAWHSLEGQSR